MLLAAGPASAKRPAEDHNAVAGQPVRKIHSGPHLEVIARDLRLTDASRERLERIAERYFTATKHRLVITGGTRTPDRQAQLMLEKLEHKEDLFALYESKPAATEIRDVYRDGVAQKHSKAKLLRAIRDAILGQIARGIYISRHLKAGAADVRSRGMTPAREQAFRAAVAAEPGVVLLDERNAAEPHLHMSL